jgi:hypothetical protein
MTGNKPGNEAAYTGGARIEERTGNCQPGLQPAAYVAQSGFTTVSLHLAERESVFVVFRNVAPASFRTAHRLAETTLTTLNGFWTVNFRPIGARPASITMPKLISWTDSTNPGVKYFSRTATYTRTIQASATWFRQGQRIWLDLGKVCDIAEVKVNGKPVDVSWAPPYRLGVTADLIPVSTGSRLPLPTSGQIARSVTVPCRRANGSCHSPADLAAEPWEGHRFCPNPDCSPTFA